MHYIWKYSLTQHVHKFHANWFWPTEQAVMTPCVYKEPFGATYLFACEVETSSPYNTRLKTWQYTYKTGKVYNVYIYIYIWNWIRTSIHFYNRFHPIFIHTINLNLLLHIYWQVSRHTATGWDRNPTWKNTLLWTVLCKDKVCWWPVWQAETGYFETFVCAVWSCIFKHNIWPITTGISEL